jgi:Zn-dependent peptidase ImmA (M78 family)
MQTKINDPRIKFSKIEAKKIINKLGIKKPPILLRAVIDLLKQSNDIEVCKWQFGENIDGVQITEGSSFTIGYNQERHVHRQRFTVAHEIGHIILGHTQSDHTFDLNCNKPKEKEANTFAAELLIPTEMLKKDISNGVDVKILSSKYFVSAECLWWKIEEEKLLNKIM